MAIAATTAMKLESATLGQLQSALCSMAEAYVKVFVDCPNEETQRGLALALICETLDAHAGEAGIHAISLKDMEPPTGATN